MSLTASAAVVAPSAVRAQMADAANLQRAHYVTSCREGVDQFLAIAFNPDGEITQRIELPSRGHDIALRPGTSECVVFARRPGSFAVAFNAQGARQQQQFFARTDRHFYGHGVFSTDGKLLFSTENDSANTRGMIGVRDATGGYKQIGEFASGGIGPHDIALLSDGVTMVVANGGIDTDGSRAPLNLDTMQPSLAYIDVRTGEITEQHTLDPSLHQLSIRHLAVAAGDVVTFGCQHEGEGQPALVGWHKRGSRPALFEAPDASYGVMKNYVGSVSVDASGVIVSATSPRGGSVLFFDVAARRLIGETSIKDVCGVAPSHNGEGFLLTSGLGAVAYRDLAGHAGDEAFANFTGIGFDNHAVLLS